MVLRQNAIPSIFAPHPVQMEVCNNDLESAQSQTLEIATDPSIQCEISPLIGISRHECRDAEQPMNIAESSNQCDAHDKKCQNCRLKNATISNLNKEISVLTSKLKKLKNTSNKWRQKSYYLETVRAKLTLTIDQMKAEKLIDAKLAETLEVLTFFIYMLRNLSRLLFYS